MTDKQVSDEELLNVFRLSDRPFLLTSDVVEDVDLGERAVQKRLKQLQKDDRLEYREAGQAHTWWLADGEPRDPVGTRGARLLRLSVRARRWSGFVWLSAAMSAGLTVFGMLSYLFVAELPNSQIPLTTKTELVELAFIAAIITAVTVTLGGLLSGTAYLLPRLAGRRTKP